MIRMKWLLFFDSEFIMDTWPVSLVTAKNSPLWSKSNEMIRREREIRATTNCYEVNIWIPYEQENRGLSASMTKIGPLDREKYWISYSAFKLLLETVKFFLLLSWNGSVMHNEIFGALNKFKEIYFSGA